MNNQGYCKKVFLCFFLFIFPNILFAGNRTSGTYRITFLNTPSIRIGDRILSVHDTFRDDECIYWKKDARQRMDVVNVSDTTVKYSVTKHEWREYQEHGVKSLFDFVKIKELGTRNVNVGKSHYSQIYHYLTDTLLLPTKSVNDSAHVEAVWIKGKKEIITPVNRSSDGRFFIITCDIYKGKKPRDIKLSIQEIDDNLNWINMIYKDIPIIYIPYRL